MTKIAAVLAVGVLCVTLPGCTKNCDDCDDACDTPKLKIVATAATSECVPAPVPMAFTPEKSPVIVAAPKAILVQPVPKVVENNVPVKIERVVEVRRVEPVDPPRLRRYFAGEIEIDGL
ncbi:MAG: hypothetical protein WCT04_18990 [Planctomycetota bacterium]